MKFEGENRKKLVGLLKQLSRQEVEEALAKQPLDLAIAVRLVAQEEGLLGDTLAPAPEPRKHLSYNGIPVMPHADGCPMERKFVPDCPCISVDELMSKPGAFTVVVPKTRRTSSRVLAHLRQEQATLNEVTVTPESVMPKGPEAERQKEAMVNDLKAQLEDMPNAFAREVEGWLMDRELTRLPYEKACQVANSNHDWCSLEPGHEGDHSAVFRAGHPWSGEGPISWPPKEGEEKHDPMLTRINRERDMVQAVEAADLAPEVPVIRADWCPACARYEERVGPGEKCLEHQTRHFFRKGPHEIFLDGKRLEGVVVDIGTGLTTPLPGIASLEDTPMPLEPHERVARRFQIVAASYRKGRGMAR